MSSLDSPRSASGQSDGGPRHRFVTDEPDIPFDCLVIYEDERILVVDKPHFLATTPRGMWYRQSVVMRLRQDLGEPEISPANRLDRQTAGLVLLTRRRQDRGAYQGLFERRQVRKMYECLAPAPGNGMAFPRLVRSRLEKTIGVLQARIVPGEPNAVTEIALKDPSELTDQDRAALAAHPGTAVYRLFPRTGKTHQLRVQMSALGLPIEGDELYPRVRTRAYDDFSMPLHLVARRLEFTDPFSGERRVFVSSQSV